MVPEQAKVIRLEPDVQRHVRSRLARLPSEVVTMHAHSKLRLQQRLRKFFSSADDTLFQHADTAPDNATQNAFFDAMRELRIQQKAVERRFLEAVDEAFAQTVEADDRDSFHSDGQLSADALSLVQNDELQQLVALEATVARTDRALAERLVPVNAALDACLPVAIDAANNPVGPQVLCSAMMGQIKRLDMDAAAKLVLFKQFEQSVLSALPKLLAEAVELLPAPPPPIDSGEAQASQSEKGPSALLQWLTRTQRLSVTAPQAKGLDFEFLLDNKQFHAEELLTLSYTERETLRMVQMLFGFVVQDPALAEVIKQQLCRLQIPIAKVALLDQAFFTNPQHPARRLLNALTSAAIGWQPGRQKRTLDDAVFKCIRSTVEQVLQQYQEDAAVFQSILSTFEQFVEEETRRASLVEKRTVSAEDGKARMVQVRTQTALAIEQVVGEQAVPACVRKLLMGPWSKVLFVTGLQSGVGEAEWNRHLLTAQNLVWSVQPVQDAGHREKLIKVIPDLAQALRQGLDLTSYNPFEIEQLLQALDDVHLVRIRGEALSASTEASLGSAASADEQRALSDAADEAFMLAVENFTRGAWFDLMNDTGEVLRCRLAAFIKPTGKYIFVNRSGAKVAERTQLELAQAMKSGQLKPLDDAMLFDRALENIVTSMRKNKLAMPLDNDQNT